jgi:hypothetical protein
VREDSVQHPVAGVDAAIVPHGMPVPFGDSAAGAPVVGERTPAAPTVEGGVAGTPIVDGLELSVPNVDGDALGVGTVTNGLIPALPISTEPSGIPG